MQASQQNLFRPKLDWTNDTKLPKRFIKWKKEVLHQLVVRRAKNPQGNEAFACAFVIVCSGERGEQIITDNGLYEERTDVEKILRCLESAVKWRNPFAEYSARFFRTKQGNMSVQQFNMELELLIEKLVPNYNPDASMSYEEAASMLQRFRLIGGLQNKGFLNQLSILTNGECSPERILGMAMTTATEEEPTPPSTNSTESHPKQMQNQNSLLSADLGFEDSDNENDMMCGFDISAVLNAENDDVDGHSSQPQLLAQLSALEKPVPNSFTSLIVEKEEPLNKFGNEDSVDRYDAGDNDLSGKQHECNICRQLFMQKIELICHLEDHLRKRDIRCKVRLVDVRKHPQFEEYSSIINQPLNDNASDVRDEINKPGVNGASHGSLSKDEIQQEENDALGDHDEPEYDSNSDDDAGILSDSDCEFQLTTHKHHDDESCKTDSDAEDKLSNSAVDTTAVEKPRKRGRQGVKASNSVNDGQSADVLEKPRKRRRSRKPVPDFYECSICGKRLQKRYTLRNHMLTHSDEKPYKCEVCGRGFRFKKCLKQHALTHTGEKRYFCETCGQGFIQKHKLTIHLRHHTGEKPFMCDFCGKSFISKVLLNTHACMHSKSSIKCELCDATFNSKQTYDVHKKRHEDSSTTATIICGVCGCGFMTIKGLRCHEAKSGHGSSNRCELCNMGFTTPKSLYNHQRAFHRDSLLDVSGYGRNASLLEPDASQKHTCTICNKTYKSKSKLRMHMRIHKDESLMLTCPIEICGAKFVVQSDLTKHMRLHADDGERVFKCKVCGCGFKTAQGLAVHQTKHQGAKAFDCSLCEKSFSSLPVLKRHNRQYH